MKKIHSMLFILFLSFSVNAQIINIPDVNFKNALLTHDPIIDSNSNGEIDQSEVIGITWLALSNKNISDLTGIEYFTGLEDLNFSSNQVPSVNLQNLSNLWRIWCDNNLLTEINLCGTNVRTLWCFDNPNLHSLYLKNNVISSDLARLIPPPLHNFMFHNTPLLTFICYDVGEYDAVYFGLSEDITGKTLVTSCDANCTLITQEYELSNYFKIYPNPVKNTLNIDLKESISVKSITIYNNLGQLIQTIVNPDFESSFILDVSKLQSGYYFMNIISDKGKATTKFIKN